MATLQSQDSSFFDLSYIKNPTIRKLVKYSIIFAVVLFVALLFMSSSFADDGFAYADAYEKTKSQISLAVDAMIALFGTGATAHTAIKTWAYTKMGIKRV